MTDPLVRLGMLLDGATLDAEQVTAEIERCRNRMASTHDAAVLHDHLGELQGICDEFLDAHKMLHDYLTRLEQELERKNRRMEW